LKEVRELKNRLSEVNKRQIDMEKTLMKINKKLDMKQFDLAKSTHAVSTLHIIIIQNNYYINICGYPQPFVLFSG
jgi:flagellar motor switch protein FliM